MEAVLTAEHLYKSFGDKVIFEDLSFGVNKGQKIALIGRNGEGKSTLLNMLFDERERDKGDVIFNSNAYPSYLPQKTWKDDDISIMDELLLSYSSHEEDKESFIARANQMMFAFGLTDLNKHINLLSGGEQKKVALAKVLLKNSQFYVLDEPTNHLDMDMIAWLENYLIKKNTTLLIVTHDRDFIDKVCTDIYELYKGQISKYNCDRHENVALFDYFLEKKEERAALLKAEIDKARNLYTRELDWINRMPQARGTKSKKRIANFSSIKEKAFQKQEKEQEKLSVVENRIGKKILEINSICKSFQEDKPLIKDFSYTFKKGDKIAIIGHNGCGKTTLLNILMDKEKQDSGTIIKGETINFGYYQQKGLQEDPTKRVIDIIKDEAESITIQNEGKKYDMSASSFLEKFGFNKDMQFHQYGLLSGGEKRRLYLLKTLIKNPNFLILDEPTNDLDIYSLLTLEEFLTNYKGCLLLVSHDKRFIENISQHHYFVFEQGGKIKDLYIPYSDYLKQKKQDQKQTSSSTETMPNDYELQKQQKAQQRKANKLSFKEQKLLEEIEKSLPLLEQKKEDLTQKLSSGELSNDELLKAGEELQQIISQIEEKELIWLELSERISQ